MVLNKRVANRVNQNTKIKPQTQIQNGGKETGNDVSTNNQRVQYCQKCYKSHKENAKHRQNNTMTIRTAIFKSDRVESR